MKENKLFLKFGERELKLEYDDDGSGNYSYNLKGFYTNSNGTKLKEEIIEEVKEKQREIYNQILDQTFKNLNILTGAGSSINESKLGKTLTQILSEVIKEIGEKKLLAFASLINYTVDKAENIQLEDYLSRADLAITFGVEDKEDIKKEIEKVIRKNCLLLLGETTAHEKFLNKLTRRNTSLPRANLFTLNYDTLFEQAAENNGTILIDGFSFSKEKIYNGLFFNWDLVYRENTLSA